MYFNIGDIVEIDSHAILYIIENLTKIIIGVRR
jgi:hypothetical protein